MSTTLASPAEQEAAARVSRHMGSFDPAGMRRALQGSALEHVQLEGGQFCGSLAQSATDGIRLDWGSYNLAVMSRGELSRDGVTLGYLVGGSGGWRVFGNSADNGDLLVLPEGSELMIRLPPGAQWVGPARRLELSPEGTSLR
jgi:hypothetical protein